MAARKNRGVGKLDETWRQNIQTSVIIDRLQKHIMGEIEMSSTQIAACTTLLKKTAPDLSVQDLNANVNGKINVNGTINFVRPNDRV